MARASATRCFCPPDRKNRTRCVYPGRSCRRSISRVTVRMARIECGEPLQRASCTLTLSGQIGRLQANPDAVLERPHLDAGIESKHFDLAGSARAQAFQDFHRTGLARSVRPQQPEDFAGSHFEVDAAHGLDFAVRFPKTTDLNRALHFPILGAKGRCAIAKTGERPEFWDEQRQRRPRPSDSTLCSTSTRRVVDPARSS